MISTRQEIKAAIEEVVEVVEYAMRSDDRDHPTLKAAAVLRAMLETFDEREDFLEAAEEYMAAGSIGTEFPRNMGRVQDAAIAMVKLYRALVAKREGK